ncbi:polyprenyl synthetase family protein [Chryseosolibacter indicus]|uniref:Polyprenyl synthetase family protein n=1 Tax=Chryseosolibacter indicus TaxID=2782351 RepID=A0ABS5VUF8_9BACT|nr:polyprenyl synthetase family protein [Chryseosolibacter indicus]MBT1703621.1 polyprenyl synthetase family protein [Chryseosolibacter indicus]
MPLEFNKYQQWLETEIKKQKYGKQPASLYEPIRYLMALGGKRLRPMLALLSYSLYKDDPKQILPYAVAVEAFHNFTLMHDDIMDQAPLRRGNVTVHEKWNVNTAILSGDVMLVKVYDMFLTLPPETLGVVLGRFNKCAAEVCEGQQWDMEFETSLSIKESQYINMIRQKTAVLLGFSLELGAILAQASAEDQEYLKEFGVNIGIGFQLKDDLLDAYADPKKFGKQVGGDIIANKKTFLLIKALEKAKGKTLKELNYWLAQKRFKKQEKINAVKRIYDALDIPRLTEKKINSFFDKGFRSLDRLSINPQKKEALINFTKALIERQS